MRRWSAEDTAYLKEALQQGKTMPDLVDHLGRTDSAIRKRISDLGLVLNHVIPEWTPWEEERLKALVGFGLSIGDLANTFRRTKTAINQKCSTLQVTILRKGRRWTEEETAYFKQRVKAGDDLATLMRTFQRTENAVVIKCQRLGMQIQREKRLWLPEEREAFQEDWKGGIISVPYMATKYHRSQGALRRYAVTLHLGPRPYNDAFLSVPDIVLELQVAKDTVYGWLKRGLPYQKGHSGKVLYLIDQYDLLSFLETHQKEFNASKLSPWLFETEPDWLIQKRQKDALFFPDRNKREYTNEEDKQIMLWFQKGESDAEIAKRMRRTEIAIANRLEELSLSRKLYNPYEIEILQKNSATLTIYELAKLLPLRTPLGIKRKLYELGLPCKQGKGDHHV